MIRQTIVGPSQSVTSVYVRTSVGTVRAHVDNSLLDKGSPPCVFVFEDNGQFDHKALLSTAVEGDVFLPQTEESESDLCVLEKASVYQGKAPVYQGKASVYQGKGSLKHYVIKPERDYSALNELRNRSMERNSLQQHFHGEEQHYINNETNGKVINLHNFVSQGIMLTSTQKMQAFDMLSPIHTSNATKSTDSLSQSSRQISVQNSNQNIFIKSSKINSIGQPTYVSAVNIPHTSSGHRAILPMPNAPVKTKDLQPLLHTKTSVGVKSESIILQKLNDVQGFSSSDQLNYSTNQTTTATLGTSFAYGSSHDSNMYSQTSNIASYLEGHNQLYQGYPSQATTASIGVSAQAIGVAQQAQYLQPGQAANQRVPISHTTRASPMTVQWLLENYETADGVSLPRSTLYNHYLRHCAENKIDAVNAASFGKLIRSVFLGLKTRRLGTRGNSKYHYYGIRVKPNSPLARLTDDTQVALRAQPVASKRPMSSGSYDQGSRLDNNTGSMSEGVSVASHQQYLGDTSEGLPELPAIDLNERLPEGISKEDVSHFGNYYRSHCEALLEVISNLQFELVEALWQAFYKSPASANKSDNGTLEGHEYNILKNTVIVLCKYKPMQEFIKETDYVLYQKLVSVLVPDVLRAVPSSLTQAIRNFAKSLENMLIGSMSEMPKEIVNIKVTAVSAFSQTLRRYTSLNHLAQAARAVLQNPQQIKQMWADLNKVDFNNVQEQSSWVCQCDETLIQKLEEDFKQTLSQQQSLEEWAHWLETVVASVLEQHQGLDSYPKAARQFLLNWSFYSSMIIRDLTLRSAASFGSFHLIRLLYDEYMFYLIENKVATHSGKSPLSVMAECVGNSLSQNYNGTMNDDEEDGDSSNDEGNLSPPVIIPAIVQPRVMNQSEARMPQPAGDEPLVKRMK